MFWKQTFSIFSDSCDGLLFSKSVTCLQDCAHLCPLSSTLRSLESEVNPHGYVAHPLSPVCAIQPAAIQ